MKHDDITVRGIFETASQIRMCQPESKIKRDTIAAKLFYRWASYYVAAGLWKAFGLKPNTISLSSGVLAVVTILVALFYPSIWLISILLIVVGLLDCADGALARYLKLAGPRGELADAIGGYVILWSVPFIAWLMLFPMSERWQQDGLLAGLVTSIVVAFHYLGRSIHQKKTLSKQDSEPQVAASPPGMAKRIQADLSFCGFMFPAFIVSWCLGWPLVGWLYAVIFLLLVGAAGLISGVMHALS